MTLASLFLLLLVSSLNVVSTVAVDTPDSNWRANSITPKAYLARYWSRQVTNHLPKPSVLFSKASPLSAASAAIFAELAAKGALSDHLLSFCEEAQLLCFPHSSSSNGVTVPGVRITNAVGETDHIRILADRVRLHDNQNYAAGVDHDNQNYAVGVDRVRLHDNQNYAVGVDRVRLHDNQNYAAGVDHDNQNYAAGVHHDNQNYAVGVDRVRLHDNQNYAAGLDHDNQNYAVGVDHVRLHDNQNYAAGVDHDNQNYAVGVDRVRLHDNQNYAVGVDRVELHDNQNYAAGVDHDNQNYAVGVDRVRLHDNQNYAAGVDHVRLHDNQNYAAGVDRVRLHDNQNYAVGVDHDNQNYAIGVDRVRLHDNQNYDVGVDTVAATDDRKVNGGVEPGKFFRESMLKSGNVMPMPELQDYMPKRSFLPRRISSKLPFSASKLAELKQIFHAAENSTMEKIMAATLGLCEGVAIQDETKRCMTSIEDMIDFATSILGHDVRVLSTESIGGSKQDVMIGVVKRIEGSEVSNPVACHQNLFPYVVYYCHTFPNVRVYEAEILEPKSKAKINHGVAICHMDTSTWSPTHQSFLLLGPGPGQIEVCHWIYENNLIWTTAE